GVPRDRGAAPRSPAPARRGGGVGSCRCGGGRGGRGSWGRARGKATTKPMRPWRRPALRRRLGCGPVVPLRFRRRPVAILPGAGVVFGALLARALAPGALGRGGELLHPHQVDTPVAGVAVARLDRQGLGELVAQAHLVGVLPGLGEEVSRIAQENARADARARLEQRPPLLRLHREDVDGYAGAERLADAVP